MASVLDYAHRAKQVREAIAWASPEPIALRSKADALAWGEKWEAQARRLQTQLDRVSMLHMCAEIHCRASDTLLEAAEDEIARLRSLLD